MTWTRKTSLTFALSSLALLGLAAGCAGSAQSAPTMATHSGPMPRVQTDEAPAMAAESSAAGFSNVNTDRALNTSSYVRTWSDDLLSTSSDFRSEVYKLGGYVVSERIDYGDGLRAMKARLPTRASKGERNKAVFAISLPVEELPKLLDWVRNNSRIVEQYVSAVRDTALPTPAQVAAGQQGERRAFLEARLVALIAELAQAATPEERAVIDDERRSVNTELSLLAHAAVAVTQPAVKYATLNVYVETEMPQARFAAARFVPTLRTSVLVTNLLSKGSDREARVGGAIGVALSSDGPGGLLPSPLLEVAGYPATGEHGAGVIATVGTGQYARSIGDGKRQWLNPFAGVRMGYAHLERSSFVASAELGVEIFKSAGIALSASVRPSAFVGKDSQVVLESGSSLSLAF
jgi:hypothetical protein